MTGARSPREKHVHARERRNRSVVPVLERTCVVQNACLSRQLFTFVGLTLGSAPCTILRRESIHGSPRFCVGWNRATRGRLCRQARYTRSPPAVLVGCAPGAPSRTGHLGSDHSERGARAPPARAGAHGRQAERQAEGESSMKRIGTGCADTLHGIHRTVARRQRARPNRPGRGRQVSHGPRAHRPARAARRDARACRDRARDKSPEVAVRPRSARFRCRTWPPRWARMVACTSSAGITRTPSTRTPSTPTAPAPTRGRCSPACPPTSLPRLPWARLMAASTSSAAGMAPSSTATCTCTRPPRTHGRCAPRFRRPARAWWRRSAPTAESTSSADCTATPTTARPRSTIPPPIPGRRPRPWPIRGPTPRP